MRPPTLSIAAMLVCSAFATANDLTNPFDHWPTNYRIEGTVIVGSELDNPTDLLLSLGPSGLTGKVSLLVDRDTTTDALFQYTAIFGRADEYHVVKRDPDKRFGELESLLTDCRTLVVHSTEALGAQDLVGLNGRSAQLQRFLSRGGNLVFLGPSAGCVAETFLDEPSDESNDDSTIRPGLGLFADCVMTIGNENESVRQQLRDCLNDRPGKVGISLAGGTLLRLAGRICSVHGPGASTFMLDSDDPTATRAIRSRQSGRQLPNDFLIDLTQWRRRAIDQQLEAFPAAEPDPPRVPKGTLFIVGGGGLPDGLMQEFVEAAGGVEAAKLVYIPCSPRQTLPAEQRLVRQWKNMGVKNATFIHTKDRHKANTDEAFLAPLKEATGIWFGGGRQWNFADSYYGTKAQTLMQEVLQRGGVVGGSSAGASVQARFLARATPIGNFQILAPGYQRGGLGFISGVAIDQHFTQRRRQKDMTQLVDRYPQLLGIGIDETTALIVKGTRGTVVGNGDVYFYNRDLPVPAEGPDYVKLGAGSSYELVDRRVVEPSDRSLD